MPRPPQVGDQIDMFPSLAGGDRAILDHVALSDIRMERTPRHVTLPPSLVQSIQTNGIMVPVALDINYNVIDGVRRIRIAHDLELETVPAMIFPHGDHRATNAMITLTANMVRSQNIINELRAIESLMRDTRVSADGLAERLGLSRRMIHNRLKLRNLRVSLRAMVESGRLALAPALVLALRSTGEQNQIAARLAQEPAFRPTAAWLRDHFGIGEEPDPQIPLLPDEVEQGVGWAIAVALCDRLIQAVPEPHDTDDPTHVEDLIFRLNHVAELIHAMTEPV